MLFGLFAQKARRGDGRRLVDQIAGEKDTGNGGLGAIDGSLQRRRRAKAHTEQRQRFYLGRRFGIRSILVELITGKERAFDQRAGGAFGFIAGRKKNRGIFGAENTGFLARAAADLAPGAAANSARAAGRDEEQVRGVYPVRRIVRQSASFGASETAFFHA